jgi:hypothetical protein
LNMMHRLSPTLSFSLLGEMSTMQSVNNYRVNVRLAKRFDTKKKKKRKTSTYTESNDSWRF